jgi:formate-dependent nitrite reductase membrane component NrfD
MIAAWRSCSAEAFRPIVKRAVWLALAGLAGGVVVLMLELGHPLRALWAIPTSFAFESPLYWKAMAIGIYVLSLLVLMARMLKSDWAAKACAAMPS